MDKKFILGHEKLRKIREGTECPSDRGLQNFCPKDGVINTKACKQCWIKALSQTYVDDTDEYIETYKHNLIFNDNKTDREIKWQNKD